MRLLFVFIITVAIVTAVTCIPAMIRHKDFKDQVSGKKEERKASSDVKVSYDKPQAENPKIAAGREELRMKGGQNLTGL